MIELKDGTMDQHQQGPLHRDAVKAHEGPPMETMPAHARDNHAAGRSTSQSWLNHLVAAMLPLVPKAMVKPFAQHYVAGETMDEMLRTVRDLNRKGISATIDLLGEFIKDTRDARDTVETYKRILDEIDRENLDANVSVKLTALGLLLDPELCLTLMRELVGYAARYTTFVRIDMEDTACTQPTIDLYLTLRQEFTNVGIVVQAYLRRTHEDVDRIVDAGAGHFRLCKGIYVEPRWLAYQLPDVINRNYTAILETMFRRKAYVGIATHDERLVWSALQLIRQYQLTTDEYEFQMLLGVEQELRDILVAAGHHVRVYVPFGRQWHAYCMRRLKENPKIVGYILQNMLQSLRR